MIDEQSAMPEVIAGLQRAEYAACYEFCRRQRPELLDVLLVGADRLGAIAFELECRNPQTLLEWKYPEVYEPVEALPEALDAACEGHENTIYDLLVGKPFADLAAIASACSHIKSAVTQIRRYGAQTPSPQQPLFHE